MAVDLVYFMASDDLKLIEKSILIMKGVKSLQEINDILDIDDTLSEEWLRLAEEDIEPYRTYARELEDFRHKNNYYYKSAIENDFKNYSNQEIEYLLEDNYLFSIDKSRQDNIELLKTRVSAGNLEHSMINLNNTKARLMELKELLFQLNEDVLLNLLNDDASITSSQTLFTEDKLKSDIVDEIISNLRLKNVDKLIENLKYVINLNDDLDVDVSDFDIQGVDSVVDVSDFDIRGVDSVVDESDSVVVESDLDCGESDFESFVDNMMIDFLNALRDGKSEEEAMDISGVNSITLMSWKMLAEGGNEDYKAFYEEYLKYSN